MHIEEPVIIKEICQYCNRPTEGSDLVKWMCSMCRAMHGHIRGSGKRNTILKRLKTTLQQEITWLLNRIAQTQRQKHSRHWHLWLRDDREILAGKQHELRRVREQLKQQIKLTGQDIKNDRLLRKLTQNAYSELLGISRMHLHRIEKGLAPINGKILKAFRNVTFSGG